MSGFFSPHPRQFVMVCAFLTGIPLDRPLTNDTELLAEAPVLSKEALPDGQVDPQAG